jgi:hypothetical protein
MIRARLMTDASEPVPGPPHLLPETGLMHETGPREAGPGLHGQIPGHLYPGQPYSDQLPGEMLKVNRKIVQCCGAAIFLCGSWSSKISITLKS